MSPLTPVVHGTAGVPVRPCRFLRAAPPAGTGAANWAWYGPALPPARRGYGYVAGMPVVHGTPVVPVRPGRFLRAAPPRRSGTANWAWYGPALAPARRGYGYVAAHAGRARYG